MIHKPVSNVVGWAALFLLQVAATAHASDWSLKVTDKDPPQELSGSIRALLQSRAVQLFESDKPAYEFWLVKELPLQSKPASTLKALDAVKQTTLLGAVNVPADRRDYRDDELRAGVYTMRLGLQPQDGNHLGTAEFLYFSVLISPEHDTKPEGITDYKPLVKASSRETSTDHPVILSLRPASSGEGELPTLVEPAPDHKSVRVKVPAKAGDDKTSLVFEIVCEGKAQH
jgi:hypothetical protein